MALSLGALVLERRSTRRGTIQFRPHPGTLLALVLQRLLKTRDLRPLAVVARLELVVCVMGLGVIAAQLFQRRLHSLPLGEGAFARQLEFSQPRFDGLRFGAKVPPPQRRQLASQVAFLSFQLLVTLGCPCLAFEVAHLPLKLLAHVRDPLQVVAGVADAVFGFPAALLVPRDASRLLDVHPQLVGLGVNQP